MSNAWIVYSKDSGRILRRCRSEENAKKYIDTNTRALRNSGYGSNANSYLPWAVCPPGCEIVSQAYGRRIGTWNYRHEELEPTID